MVIITNVNMSKRNKILKLSLHLIVISVLIACNVPNDNNFSVVQRSDNDFVTYADTVSARNKCCNKLNDHIKRIYSDTVSLLQVFKVNSKHINIFVVKIKENISSIKFDFLAYDTKTDIISTKPVSINGKWMNNNEAGFEDEHKLLTKPLIDFIDIDNDGINEIVIKERVHNGNIYNAVISHYFGLDKKMNWIKKVSIESSYIHFMYNTKIIRTLKGNYIVSEIESGQNTFLVGKTEIDIFNLTIKNKQLYLPKYKGYLLTGSGVKEDLFIREGYKFSY